MPSGVVGGRGEGGHVLNPTKPLKKWDGYSEALNGGAGSRGVVYSHSIVAGGLLEMSSATLFTPGTSLMIRLEARSSRS